MLVGFLTLSALLIASTSSDLGGLVTGNSGHDVALALGMFFWGGVALYIATAWRVRSESARPPDGIAHDEPHMLPAQRFPLMSRERPRSTSPVVG